MIPLLEEILAALGARVDREAIARGYVAVSVDVTEARAWLEARGLAYVSDEDGRFPAEEDLARTSREVIESYRTPATAVGIVGAFGGWVGVAPELAATLVQSLRLAQRLAVVHGFDPHSDRGGIVVARAMAVAWEVPLPEQGAVGVRLAEVPARVRAHLAAIPVTTVAGWVARAGGRSVLTRVVRFVPGLSAVLAARNARARIVELGERMEPVVRRAMDAGSFTLEGERPAEELRLP